MKATSINIKKNIFVLVAALLATVNLYSQQYPIQINAFLVPPYSVKLSELSYTGETKLQLQLLMTDLMQMQHRVRLRFSLENQSSSQPLAYTPPYFAGQCEYTLIAGAPLHLTNIDLRPLFELQNLAGISPQDYSNPLRQGVYKFCFQAFDIFTNQPLSAKSYAMAYIIQYEPPMLNLPQRGEKIMGNGAFQNILFQWMPRQIAPNTKYIFTLKEILLPDMPPEQGFMMSRVLYQEETHAQNLLYGPDKSPLLPNTRYAWQVRAISANPALPGGSLPTDDNGVYVNGGNSEIYYFDYVENCQTPMFLTAKNQGRGRTALQWSMPSSPSMQYKVQYRKAAQGGYWSDMTAYSETANLTGLKDETEYEYRVGAVCGNLPVFETYGQNSDNAYTFSAIQRFTTDKKRENDPNFQCGVAPQIKITNRNLLQRNLAPNETFTAGDFPVTVLAVDGSNGIYSGAGYVQVPYLGDAKLVVEFKNIKINTDLQLIEGVVETTYDIKESDYQYVSEGLGETFGDSGAKSVTVNYEVGEIKVDSETGRITIFSKPGENGETGETASQQELPGGQDYVIVDSSGKVWSIDESGHVTEGGEVSPGGTSSASNTEGVSGSGSNAAVTQYTQSGVTITWDASNSIYAFDAPQATGLPGKNYQTLKDSNGNTVDVPYKAVVNGQTDEIKAILTFTDNSLKDRQLVFKTLSSGREIPATKNSDTEYTLQLKGMMDYAEEEVIAMLTPTDSTQKQQVVSSFKLVHLSPKTIKVTLVPTDAASKSKLAAIKEKTNAIFAKAGITIDFNEDAIFDITPYLNGSNKIATEDNTLLSTYSAVQQAINAAYGDKNGDRYILFVTGRPSSTGQMGYMRLNGRFGYVFGSATDKTAAHELGHGILKLEHPWDKYGTDRNKTQLLMDYSDGAQISHLDWKQVNDPALKFYLFQRQSEGESIENPSLKCISEELANSLGKSFISPDGKNITLRSDEKPFAFFAKSEDILYGRLAAYKKGNQIYIYYLNAQNNQYSGYWGEIILGDQKDASKLVQLNQGGNGQLVEIDDNCRYKDYTISDCKWNFTIGASPSGSSYKAGGKITLPTENISSGNTQLINHSKLSTAEIEEVLNQWQQQSQADIGITAKVYLLDTSDPEYEKWKKEAGDDSSPNRLIYTINTVGGFELSYKFDVPEWVRNLFGEVTIANEDCFRSYINESLAALRDMQAYKEASLRHKILYEYVTAVYQGFFGYYYCLTSETAVENRSATVKFLAGASHEAIAILDVAAMVEGLYNMAKGMKDIAVNSYIEYLRDIRITAKELLSGNFTFSTNVALRLIPPHVRAQIVVSEKVVEVVRGLVSFYFIDCEGKEQYRTNMCPYRYGQVTLIAVPIVLSGGEYATGKIAKWAKGLKNLKWTKAEEVVNRIRLAEEAGHTVLYEGERIVIKNGEETVATISKSGDAVEIVEIVVKGGSKNFVNNPFDEIRKLKKNVRYKTGEFEYFGETDHLGRLEKGEANNLQLTQRTERLPHNPNTPGKVAGDDAGHIIADRFGGSPELDNLVSQTSNVNRSQFATLENRWANALERGQKVEVEIKVNYNGNDVRPSSFDVTYTIDGETVNINILNN
ncbi:hypothetical protein FACS189413_05940 [Bacteroidia bacterium]|nr:hypothetical protein FACS189413_05940 [Bacteroidia bacterium]